MVIIISYKQTFGGLAVVPVLGLRGKSLPDNKVTALPKFDRSNHWFGCKVGVIGSKVTELLKSGRH